MTEFNNVYSIEQDNWKEELIKNKDKKTEWFLSGYPNLQKIDDLTIRDILENGYEI